MELPIELRSWWWEVKPDENELVPDDGYRLAGWTLELVVDGRTYALGRSDNRSREVNFYGTRLQPTPETSSPYSDDFGDVQRIRGGVPYDDPIFVKAARWLLDQPGIDQLRVFLDDVEYSNNPFVPVDPDRLG